MEKTAVKWLGEKIKKTPTLDELFSNIDSLLKEAEQMEIKNRDEYAIEFVNWIVNPDTTDLLHDLKLFGEINEHVPSKQLLEIYKKEEGL